MPMLKLSKTWMDPTGGELMDKLLSNMPIYMNAVDKNDVKTIHRIINDNQKFLRTITPHITHPEVRKAYSERIDALSSIVTCMSQGKCGCKALFHYVGGCVMPLKTLFTSLSGWIVCSDLFSHDFMKLNVDIQYSIIGLCFWKKAIKYILFELSRMPWISFYFVLFNSLQNLLFARIS